AGAVHRLELGVGHFFADESDALGLVVRAFERIDHRAVVFAVARRLNDHVLVEAEKVAQRGELLLGRIARRVFALGRVGELALVPEPVAGRVARPRRRPIFRLGGIGVEGDVAWTHRHGGVSLLVFNSTAPNAAGAVAACALSPAGRRLLAFTTCRDGGGGSDPSPWPVTPSPQPSPQGGEGAHRACGTLMQNI